MYKIINLNLMVTRTCNLRCRHCMRGDAANESVSDEVLEAVFKPDTVIQHLQLNGGEVFTRPDILAKIVQKIIQNRVSIAVFEIITNGTLFTPEIEKLIDRLDHYVQFSNYVTKRFISAGTILRLSYDKYHLAELDRIKSENIALYYEYMDNIERLTQSRYFGGMNEIGVLADAGRARELDEPKVPPLRFTMFYSEQKTPLDNVVSISTLGVDINGVLCNTCGEMPPKPSSIYGNLLTEKCEDILARTGVKCYSEEEMFARYQEEAFRMVRKIGAIK